MTAVISFIRTHICICCFLAHALKSSAALPIIIGGLLIIFEISDRIRASDDESHDDFVAALCPNATSWCHGVPKAYSTEGTYIV